VGVICLEATGCLLLVLLLLLLLFLLSLGAA